MPEVSDPDGSQDAGPPKLSLGQRLLLHLPRFGRSAPKAPLGERLRGAVLKPGKPGAAAHGTAPSEGPQSIQELEEAVRRADDKERAVGLVAAPFAGAIGVLVISALVSNDPPALLKNGQANRLHVSVGLYHELEIVLLVLAVLMLVMALARKRLFLGIVTALYGLAIFNLHYWGFGVPYLMVGAWLLVRSYRLQRELREATGDTPGRPAPRRQGSGGRPPTSRAKPNKRYTPPT